MPCGYGAERAASEAYQYADRLAAPAARAVDASSYFSRPGPRLVDGIELLAHVLHPDRVARRRPAAWSSWSCRRDGRMKHAEHQRRVDGTPQECFDALLDYESFPDWQRAVKAVEVSRDDDGRGRDVEFEIDAKVRTIRYGCATRTSRRTGSRGTTWRAT